MIGGLMSINIPRRKFLKAAGGGLLLPAAGRASTTGPKAAFQPPSNVVHLGQTGPKVCGVGCGIGFVPLTEEASRALDMGINYFDTSRDYGDSDRIFSDITKGRNRVYAPYYMIYS
jgi:anaerobic selenocysteine-containing dehydrogenase